MNSVYKNTSLLIIKVGLFIVPFIPLYISRSLFFPYITGKAFIFRFLIEIAFAVWIFLAIFYKEYRPKKTELLVALSAFILILIASTLFAANPSRAFWSNFERMEGLITHLHLFAYFLVLSSVFTKKDWFTFLNLFMVSGLLENFYALSQRLGYIVSPQGGARVDGTIGNPTYLAAYLIFIMAFALLLWFWTEYKVARYFYAFVGLFSLLTIYFTGTRGVVLALLVGGIFAGVLYLILGSVNTSREKLYKKVIASVLVLMIIAPMGLWFAKDTEFVKNKEVLKRFASTFSEISEFVNNSLGNPTKTNAQARTYIWSMSIEGIKERPILGWGLDNYNIVFAKHFRPELYSKEPWFDRSHNIILDWSIHAGLLGLLAYLSVIGSAMWMLWKGYWKRAIGLKFAIILSVLLLVYFLQNLFVFDQLTTYIVLFAVLAFIHSYYLNDDKKDKGGDSLLSNRDAPLVIVLLLIPLVLVMYFINVKPFLANSNLLAALKAQNNNLPLAFDFYKKALSYNTFGNQETREQLTRFSLSVGALSGVDRDFVHEVLGTTIKEVEKGVEENIMDPRSYLFLGTMYQKTGFIDKAIEVYESALKLSPRKQQIYFELADLYIVNQDYFKAVELLEQAFELAPTFDRAFFNLISAYSLAGEPEKGDKLLIEKFGTTDVFDALILNVYRRVKDYPRQLRATLAMVKSGPNNLDYRKILIGTYLIMDDNDSALEEMKKAIDDFPEFKKDGQQLIQELLGT